MEYFQVNLFIEPIAELGMFKKLKSHIFFPAFWFETKMVIADNMKIQLWILSNMKSIFIGQGVLMIGMTLAIFLVVAIVKATKAKRARTADIPEDGGSTTQESRGNEAAAADAVTPTGHEDATDNSVTPLIS